VAPSPTPPAERPALAATLALVVHLLFLALMVFAVSWQTRPAPVVAEVWSALPGAETPPPPARLEPAPEPSRPVETPPPPPPPAPEKAPEPPKPQIAPPPPAKAPLAKPEIVLEKKKPEDKRLAEVEARHRRELAEAARRDEELKREAEAAKTAEQARQRELQAAESQRQREQLAAQAVAAEQQRQRDLQAAQASAAEQQRQLAAQQARARAIDVYRSQIMAAVRARLVEPPGVQGNPQAQVEVLQLPNGEVMAAKVTRSSGIPAVDEAFERAVLAASPLPLPGDRNLFERKFTIQFRLRE